MKLTNSCSSSNTNGNGSRNGSSCSQCFSSKRGLTLFMVLATTCVNLFVQMIVQSRCNSYYIFANDNDDARVSMLLPTSSSASSSSSSASLKPQQMRTRTRTQTQTQTHILLQSSKEQQEQEQQRDDHYNSACLMEYQRVTATRLEGLNEEDLKRSKTYRGNRYRLSKLVQKLHGTTTSITSSTTNSTSTGTHQSKSNVVPSSAITTTTAIKAVVCGGSISLGHGVMDNLSYSHRLEDWFNDKYPTTTTTTIRQNTNQSNSNSMLKHHNTRNKRHRVINRGTHGADVSGMICCIVHWCGIINTNRPRTEHKFTEHYRTLQNSLTLSNLISFHSILSFL